MLRIAAHLRPFSEGQYDERNAGICHFWRTVAQVWLSSSVKIQTLEEIDRKAVILADNIRTVDEPIFRLLRACFTAVYRILNVTPSSF